MEPPRRLTLGYSLKNIPIPPEDSYLKALIDKATSVIRRMRWRAHYYLTKGKDDENVNEHYGFKSRRSPPNIVELNAFEEDLVKLIETVTFRKFHDKFQDALRKDIGDINRSKSVFVPADKTRNVYEIGRQQYDKLLRENVTKHYRTADENAYDDINVAARNIVNQLGSGLAERMDAMAKSEAYITLKDHKENFADKLPCLLINPAKSEMGKISKSILDNINGRLREKTGVTLWSNSMAVAEWFKGIADKNRCTFVCFDIAEFYPSISEGLLRKALAWAKMHTEITENEIEVIYNSRKSLLFSKGKTWMKRDGGGLFDVAMGSYDGAEVCELIGSFALATLPVRYRAGNIGLYRDDGLGYLRNMTGRQTDRAKKDIQDHFKELGLRITIEANLRVTNFLDLTLNFNTGKYYPYRKPNDTPLYISRSSNHPPAILKSLPAAISRRLTDISSDGDVFADSVPLYNEALQRSGYSEGARYMNDRKAQCKGNQRRKTRQRNITWFNPPFSKNVVTDVGRKFLRLVDRHFPKGSKLHKIFNRGTLKVSYSCMPNIGTIIKRHNSRISSESSSHGEPLKLCNCRKPGECPLRGKCLARDVVYQATVTTVGPGTQMHYIGSTATSFKTRYNNHKASMTHAVKANQTELSKYTWQLDRDGAKYDVAWKILQRASSYSNISKRCDLCLTEKLLITRANKATLLNKRSEIASKCRHKSRFCLSNFAPQRPD